MNLKKQELKELKAAYKKQKKAIKVKYAKSPETEEEKLLQKEKKRELRKEKRIERRRLRKERTEAMPKRYSVGEEIFNSISHGVGAGLSIAAIVLLAVRAVTFAPAGHKTIYTVSFVIFGSTLLLLYLMSTLYHALTPYDAKNVFGRFDHSSIYILIAGTYTPLCLTVMNPVTGWVMFGIIWALAIFGTTMYSIFGSRMRLLSAITYLPMGMLIFFAYKQLLANLPPVSVIFLLVGGALYIVGWPFYLMKKIKWMHCIFHLFVLAASVFHFFSIYLSI